MSRRHHGRPHHHAPGGADTWRRNTTGPAAGASFSGDVPAPRPEVTPSEPSADGALTNGNEHRAPSPMGEPPPDSGHAGNGEGSSPEPHHEHPVVAPPFTNGHVPTNGHAPMNGSATNGVGHDGHLPNGNAERTGQCTSPQLRRFIKSRPYVPMHELRRRFGIVGPDDDVTPVKLDPGWVYVGLPSREGLLLGDLLKSGEIGYELSLDPRTPIVIGVYPMRPIPRS